MQLNQKYIQLASDSLIPLLGFFLWEWSLYFIVLFYLFDLISGEVIVNLKAKSIFSHQNLSLKKWLFKTASSLVITLVIIFLSHIAIYLSNPEINFYQSALDFWNYEELGIKQGYLLVPLVFFAAFMRYKMEFIRTKKFETETMQVNWSKHISMNLVLLIGIVVASIVLYFVVLPDVVLLLLIVLLTSGYKYKFT